MKKIVALVWASLVTAALWGVPAYADATLPVSESAQSAQVAVAAVPTEVDGDAPVDGAASAPVAGGGAGVAAGAADGNAAADADESDVPPAGAVLSADDLAAGVAESDAASSADAPGADVDAGDAATPAAVDGSVSRETSAPSSSGVSPYASFALTAATPTNAAKMETEVPAADPSAQSADVLHAAPLDEGVYTVAASDGAMLRAADDGADAVEAGDSDHRAVERWNVARVATDDDADAYAFVNVANGRVLADDGGQASLKGCAASSTRAWVAVAAPDGKYYLVNVSTGRYLTRDDSGAVICGTQRATAWLLARCAAGLPEDTYEVVAAKDPAKRLDVRGGSDENGARIQIYQDNGTIAQRFVFDYDEGTGYYLIGCAGSGRVLDVTDGSLEWETPLQQFVSNDTLAQRWDVVANGDGTFTIYSALSGLVLDLTGGQTANGTPVQLFVSNETIAQRFMLHRAATLPDARYEATAPGTLPALAADERRADRVLDAGLYQIYAYPGTGALGVGDSVTLDGAELHMSGFAHGVQQRWSLMPLGLAQTGEWTYALVNLWSDEALTARNARLYQSAFRGELSQRWVLRALVDKVGVYRLVSAYAGAYFNVQQRSDRLVTDVSHGAQLRFAAVKRALADGSYTIAVGTDGAQVLGVADSSPDDGAAFEVEAATRSIGQIFGLSYDASIGYYTLASYASGKVLDVASGSVEPGARLQQYTPNGTWAQYWALAANGDGTWSLYAAWSGRALEVAAATGSSAHLARTGSGDVRAFRFAPAQPRLAEGTYMLRAGDGSLVADVRGGSIEAGAAIQVFVPNGTLSQTFELLPLENGEYALVSARSGMRMTEDGATIVQRTAENDAHERWRLEADGRGHFLLANAFDGRYLAPTSLAREAALTASTTSAGWNLLATSLDLNGSFKIITADNHAAALDVYYGSLDAGTAIDVYTVDGGLQTDFVFERQDDGTYEIYDFFSLLNFDVPSADAFDGQGIQQYIDNSTPAQRWTVSVRDGGLAIQSALGSYLLGHKDGWANLQTPADFNLAQRFILREVYPKLGMSSLLSIVDSIGESGIAVGHSRAGGLSAETYAQVADAIGAYGSDGVDVGFVMVDLTTGATLSYNPDERFFSASSVKGPYVAALNKWDPDGADGWANTIYSVVAYSNNEAYASLFDAFGSWPLDWIIDETGSSQFSWNGIYANYPPRTLSKFWVDMADYFMSDDENAWWCRDLFGNNRWITSRGALDGRTVYAKSGWMVADEGDWCTIHNEGYCVADGDHPYVVAIMSTQNHYESWYMADLVRAIDAAHAELVG